MTPEQQTEAVVASYRKLTAAYHEIQTEYGAAAAFHAVTSLAALVCAQDHENLCVFTQHFGQLYQFAHKQAARPVVVDHDIN